ncbi:hypothetical protein [Paenibacillus hamazuiensis]|uniref:hypothetical protein n=1 Tax=Paenibacillus hamazuiensis TaxID=2936508 RepID=UPI00200C041F|nr:hypothetical protein [Paenibacillus hamazuiensis]
MTKSRAITMFMTLIFAAIAACAVPAAAQADQIKMPEELALLADTPLYDDASADAGQVGVLSAYQQVSVSAVVHDEEETEGIWYLVQTSLGEKWVRGGPSVAEGRYYKVYMEVGFTGEEDMYDLPRDDQKSGAMLSPQKVTAIGQLIFCNGVIPAGDLSESERCHPWYRVRTYLGDKWIHPAKAIEHYEIPQAKGAYTPSSAFYLAKFSSELRILEPILERFSLKPVAGYTENDIYRLEVRKPYHHREKLNDEEAEALKTAIFEAVGGTFPLSVTTFTLSEKPDLTGKLMQLDKTKKRALIVSYDKRFGITNPIPDADWFSMAEDTNIHWKGDDRKLTFDDLKVGQTIEAWQAKLTLLSYPGQTAAYELAIVEDAKSGEEGVPLGTILGLDLTRIDKIELEIERGRTKILESPGTIQAISERMQHIRLQLADNYPDNTSYAMTLYQGNRKAVYSGNLLIDQLAYKPTELTAELDDFILKLKNSAKTK